MRAVSLPCDINLLEDSLMRRCIRTMFFTSYRLPAMTTA
jgi:hypothetical protein